MAALATNIREAAMNRCRKRKVMVSGYAGEQTGDGGIASPIMTGSASVCLPTPSRPFTVGFRVPSALDLFRGSLACQQVVHLVMAHDDQHQLTWRPPGQH